MTRKTLTQSMLDNLWSAYDAGETDIKTLAMRVGFTETTVREIIRYGRRIGPDCDLERKALALAEFRRGVKSGDGVFESAKNAGITYSDALREHKAMLSEIETRPRDTLRPRHVTAEPFSDEWYDQQEVAFARAMRLAHPELAGGVS